MSYPPTLLVPSSVRVARECRAVTTSRVSLSAKALTARELALTMGAKSRCSETWNMYRWFMLLLLKCIAEQLAFCANFTVSYLTADRTKTFIKNKQGRIISGAMSYAIQKVGAFNVSIIFRNSPHESRAEVRRLGGLFCILQSSDQFNSPETRS